MSDEKWVRVMCDFSAEGVWAKDGAGISMDELPISREIKQRLLEWQEWFERDYENYLPPSQRTTNFDAAHFSRVGLEIAKAIKAELPDWTVVYFDEERSSAGDRSSDRASFEYEVLQDAAPAQS